MNATEQQAWSRLCGVPKLSHMFPHPLSIKGVGFSSDLLRMFVLVPNSEGKYIRCQMCVHLEGMFVCNTVTERVVFFHVTRFHAVLWRSLNWPDDAVPKMYSQWVRRVHFECSPGPHQRITILTVHPRVKPNNQILPRPYSNQDCPVLNARLNHFGCS